MAVPFIIILASCSILVSLIALYVLIIASFERKEKEEAPQSFVKRDARIIKVDQSPGSSIVTDADSNRQIIALISTVLLGQGIALYFLMILVPQVHIVPGILRLNGFILLFASIICSIMTISNAWLKKRMVVLFRVGFQSYSLFIALVLFRIGVRKGESIKEAVVAAGFVPNIIIIMYFSTVIIALALMLLDGLYRKNQRVDFDFNKYFRLVILIGMVVGLGLTFTVSIMHRR